MANVSRHSTRRVPTGTAPRPGWALLGAVLLLAACAGPGPRKPAPLPPAAGRDGGPARLPPGLDQLPDAEPRVEAQRNGGPNKAYEVNGRWYTPLLGDAALRDSGLASWYGSKFHGRPTASGEPYDMYAMTAAHKTWPIPSYARVRNPANGREIVVRVNDRGPFVDGRVIDLSYAAAARLGVLGGVAPVELQRITHDEIRAGLWQPTRRPATVVAAAPGQPPVPAPAPVIQPLPLPQPVDAPPARADDDPLGAMLAERGLAAPRDDVAAARDRAQARAAAPGHWLQLGAFGQRDAAWQLRERLLRDVDGLAALISVFEERGLARVQAGPYASRADAERAAERLRPALDALPLLFERR